MPTERASTRGKKRGSVKHKPRPSKTRRKTKMFCMWTNSRLRQRLRTSCSRSEWSCSRNKSYDDTDASNHRTWTLIDSSVPRSPSLGKRQLDPCDCHSQLCTNGMQCSSHGGVWSSNSRVSKLVWFLTGALPEKHLSLKSAGSDAIHHLG